MQRKEKKRILGYGLIIDLDFVFENSLCRETTVYMHPAQGQAHSITTTYLYIQKFAP